MNGLTTFLLRENTYLHVYMHMEGNMKHKHQKSYVIISK